MRSRTTLLAVAVNAVTTLTPSSFMTLPRVRYDGLKVSPHSLTQWASSIAMCEIFVCFNT